MNSFNHYWTGACGEFLFAGIGGISSLEPGYRRFAVAPVIRDGLYRASASYDSIYGTIVSRWVKEAGKTVLTVTVPANTQAEIRLPTESPERVTEGDLPLTQAAGLTLTGQGRIQAAAGTYVFQWQERK
jgi:alpha-L-rhamnosidase